MQAVIQAHMVQSHFPPWCLMLDSHLYRQSTDEAQKVLFVVSVLHHIVSCTCDNAM